MNFSWLTLRDLEYLVAIAELQHFGKAAEATHVSQPALSAQIKKIENYLGQPLFERSSRRVSVTPLGERVAKQARIVLEEARKIAELARDKRETLTGPFRLGAIASVGPYLLPYLLAPIRKKYPKLELFIREGLTPELIPQLRGGQLDAVIASPTFDSQGLRELPLFHEPFLVAAPTGHAILKTSPLKPASLNAADMILLEDGHCLTDQTLDLCHANRRGGTNQKFQATGLETLRQLVASGAGYTLVPQLAVTDDARLKGLIQYKPFESEKRVGRVISLYCRERFPAMDDIDRLAAVVRASLPASVSKLQ